jgi:hypothetical protein
VTHRISTRTALLLALCAVCISNVSASDDSVFSRGKHLFVDDAEIESMRNVTRTLNTPIQVPENPIVKPDQPWESTLTLQPGTVIYDEQEHIFKMWYNSLPTESKPDIQEFMCYATSTDGIHWTKPALNLIEYHGSAANNIFLKWCSWTLSVIKDMREPDPARRYKLAYWVAHDVAKKGVWVAFSADGIHWNLDEHNPVIPGASSGDTFCVMQDPVSGEFWMYHKSAIMPIRKVSRLVSKDFIHWKNDELVLDPDDRDQPDTEFYGLSPFPFGNQYLGLLWVFHTYRQQIDVQLVSSRDGRTWDRSAHRRVFLPLGFMKNDYDGHAFDSEMIMAIAPPVAVNGELWMYYTGYSNKHNANTHEEALLDTYLGQIGVVKLPMDGFCSIDATSEGSVVTRPVHVAGSALHITASTKTIADQDHPFDPTWAQLFTNDRDGVGEVRVELQDEQGKIIPGFSAAECKPITGHIVDGAVAWTSGKNLSALRGQSVRLKFVLQNAKLYSYSTK